MTLRRWACVLAALAVLAAGAGCARGCRRGALRRPLGAKLEVIGVYESGFGPTFPSSLGTLKEHGALLSAVAPFWFTVGPQGDFQRREEEAQAMAEATRQNLPVLPIVSNLTPGVSPAETLATPASRRETAGNLAALASEEGYGGIILAFLNLPPDQRGAYTRFVQDLGRTLRRRGKLLGVFLPPRVERAEAIWGAYDYGALSAQADFVVVSAYDYRSEATRSGPVAPQAWVEAVVDDALTHVPATKLVLGIGMYGYDWPALARRGLPEFIPNREAVARAARQEVSVRLDREAMEDFYRYASGGVTRTVYYQGHRGLVWKLDLAHSRRLRGVLLWRLGYEENGFWDTFARELGQR